MRLFSRGGVVKGMPGLGAWTAYREFPAPAKRTFMGILQGSGERPMSARETILNAVRSGLGNTAVDPAALRPRRGRAAAGSAFHPPAAAGRWPGGRLHRPCHQPKVALAASASPARASCRRRSVYLEKHGACPRCLRCSPLRRCRPWTGPGSSSTTAWHPTG